MQEPQSAAFGREPLQPRHGREDGCLQGDHGGPEKEGIPASIAPPSLKKAGEEDGLNDHAGMAVTETAAVNSPLSRYPQLVALRDP